MIKTIFFDAFGTLFHLRGSVGEQYASVARKLGAEISPEEFDDAFCWVWNHSPVRPAIDHARVHDDKPWWRDLVGAVIGRIANIPAEFDRHRFFELAYAHFTQREVWKLYPEVRDVLEALAPDFRLAIISNFDRRLHTILRHLEIAPYFDGIFISSELGADKPDPEIYRRALKRSGSRSHETIHAGDDPERDWQPAKEVGMHVFELDRPQNSLRNLMKRLSAVI